MATIKTCINETLQNSNKKKEVNKNIVVKTLRYYRLEKKTTKTMRQQIMRKRRKQIFFKEKPKL